MVRRWADFEVLPIAEFHSLTCKRFTPLAFVCNPGLLTSEHGKKVKLLHFVKKSVAPKLQSFILGHSTRHSPGVRETRTSKGSYNLRKNTENVKDTIGVLGSSRFPRTEEERVLGKLSDCLASTEDDLYLRFVEVPGQEADSVNLTEIPLEDQHKRHSRGQALSESKATHPLTAAT